MSTPVEDATFDEWHQAMKDGKEWAWAPTQVMYHIHNVLGERDHWRGNHDEQVRIKRMLHEEVGRLRRGLRQIVEGDYPAEAGNAETWAGEVLHDSTSVDWQTDG